MIASSRYGDAVISFYDATEIPTFSEADETTIARLQKETQNLTEQLTVERALRHSAEEKVEELQKKIAELEINPPRKRCANKPKERTVGDYKSDGKRKPHAADPIRSYEDFKAIQDYFLTRNKIRDWTLWTMGVSLGLRISDLLSLRIGSLLNNDRSFRTRLFVKEQKTSKINNCLITEAVKDAATKLFDSMGWEFDLEDYLFKSAKTKGKMFEEYGWKILSDAGKALNLPIVIGSHTMRKSFANIAACVDKSNIDMNAITKIQGLLNHSDQRVTMRYLGTYQTMFDKAREAVSDFVLGKTDVHELVAGANYSIDDIMKKLDQLEQVVIGE